MKYSYWRWRNFNPFNPPRKYPGKTFADLTLEFLVLSVVLGTIDSITRYVLPVVMLFLLLSVAFYQTLVRLLLP
jgi:hypothetical protein